MKIVRRSDGGSAVNAVNRFMSSVVFHKSRSMKIFQSPAGSNNNIKRSYEIKDGQSSPVQTSDRIDGEAKESEVSK